MTKKIILRMGMLKTGNSSTHDTLWHDKDLKKSNCHYLKSISFDRGFSVHRAFAKDPYRYRGLVRERISVFRLCIMNWVFVNNFINEIHANHADSYIAIIESTYKDSRLEFFGDFLYKYFGDDIDIELVWFVRNPLDLSSSRAQQISKIRFDEDFLIQISSGKVAIDNIKCCVDVFGADKVRVYKFEDAIQHPYGPVGFFYEHVLHFSPEDIAKVNIIKSNESASQIAIDICNFINKRIPRFDSDGVISSHRPMYDLTGILKSITGGKFQLHKHEKQHILNMSCDYVKYLEDNFNIIYSIEEMQEKINNSKDPLHIPTCKNLTEITHIFYRLNSNIQRCVIEYLYSIRDLVVHDKESFNNCIQQLERMEKNFINKIFRIYFSSYYKARSIAGKIKRIMHPFIMLYVRKKILQVYALFKPKSTGFYR